jgi:hypothetical protein
LADDPWSDDLDGARLKAHLSRQDLWQRYFELGGRASPLELEAILEGVLEPSRYEYDILAHALNERFAEIGEDPSVPYRFHSR